MRVYKVTLDTDGMYNGQKHLYVTARTFNEACRKAKPAMRRWVLDEGISYCVTLKGTEIDAVEYQNTIAG